MQDVVELTGHEHKLAHIVVMKLKVFPLKQVLNIGQVARHEVVHGNDMVALGQEPVAEVRAQEAGPAGNEHTLFFGAVSH
jgi:hypothetical protein